MTAVRSRIAAALVVALVALGATPASAAPLISEAGDIAFSVASGTFTSSVTVSLSTAVAGAQIRYTTDGAVPTVASALYANPLTLTATTQLRAQAFVGGAASGLIGTQIYVRRAVDAANNNLPLLLLDDYGKGKPGRDYVDAAAMLFDPGVAGGTTSLAAAPAIATRAVMRLRGQSSATFDKAPWRIEFRDDADGDAGYPVLGMPADGDWVLRGPFPDKALVREAVLMEIAQKMGLATPRYRFVELYANFDANPVAAADYQGVYLLEETIENDKDRLDLKKLDPEDVTEPDVTGGYIMAFEWLAAEEPVLTCTGAASTCFNFLEVKDPDDLVPEQRAWINGYVQRFHDMLHSATFATQYQQWIDVGSFVDLIILNEFSRDMDAYVRSTYFYKDRGGPLVAGPLWDKDLTFGVGGYESNNQTAGFQYQSQNRQPQASDWFKILLGDPAFQSRLRARWQSLRTTVLSEAAVTTLVNDLTTPLTAGAARNFQKWPNLTTPMVGPFLTPTANTWQGQVQTMRTWMTQRATWLDSTAGWGGGVTPTPTPTPAPAAACTATYSQTGQWAGGFQGEVRVTAGGAALSGWTVTLGLAAEQTVSQVWNGVLASNDGSRVGVRNASYNGSLAAGASATFGLLGSWSGSAPAPSLSCAGT
jgi:CotH protein/cellulose binding protein with CBM2 domain/chitobiase/beta-hexosaminidase-like protein